GLRRSQRVDAGKVRRAEPGGAAPVGRRRHQDPSVLQVDPGGRRKSLLRALRGAQGKEQALGARLSRVEEVPRRTVPVVPRRRVDLRQLFVFLEDRRTQVAYLGDYPLLDTSLVSCQTAPDIKGAVMDKVKRKQPRIHQLSIAQFEALFPHEDACCAYLMGNRWPDGVNCPRCGHDKVWALGKPWHWQ